MSNTINWRSFYEDRFFAIAYRRRHCNFILSYALSLARLGCLFSINKTFCAKKPAAKEKCERPCFHFFIKMRGHQFTLFLLMIPRRLLLLVSFTSHCNCVICILLEAQVEMNELEYVRRGLCSKRNEIKYSKNFLSENF